MTGFLSETSCITLRVGDAICEVWPESGGSIGRWAIGGQEMFHRASSAVREQGPPLSMATFPLVPYSNRIGFGRFNWGGRKHQLATNFAPEPHATHGTGWTAKWDVEHPSSEALILRYRHQADKDWPWPFEAKQQIALSSAMLTLHLSARNLADQIAPLAFGYHPFL